ncbi:olfactory receptor 5P55-like [Dendropsophus ebraccatus]|uniref:olfactory receptor 5P55-like n=1 Tax=Dendropsophus ebraccatus TaxID=150705 RepID=UPI003831C46A
MGQKICEENETKVTEFRLSGFHTVYGYRTVFFVVMLVIYIVIMVGNLLIIFLVSIIDHLQVPMFFFLKHLAMADVLLTTTVMPIMLDMILRHGRVISVIGCFIQMSLYGIFVSVQCFLLAVMSYDRYLAICSPLHYASVMNPNRCLQLVSGSWSLVVSTALSELVSISQFELCGLNIIDNFVCDLFSVVELSSSDTSTVLMEDFVFSIFILVCPLTFIIITYICILITIMKITSTSGRKKAFSTCSSHLTTVCTYYGTLITVCIIPSKKSSSNVNMYLSLLYIVLSPLINPFIYSLRNREFERALKKILKRIQVAKEEGMSELTVLAKCFNRFGGRLLSQLPSNSVPLQVPEKAGSSPGKLGEVF